MTPENKNKWLVTLSVGFGSLMGSIDASIVNVAMPQIRGSIGATIQEITWISTAYMIAMVIIMPLTAFLGRLFGQKNVYLFFLGLFLAGSVMCGFSNSLVSLAVFRFIQGFGAGALQPTQQAILRQTFPPKEQGMAMAVFGVVIAIGPAIGLLLGGWIVSNWHWAWIFFINVPIGIIGIIMVSLFLHEDPEIVRQNHAKAELERKNIDWPGIIMLIVGLSSLVYFLEEGAAHDWFSSGTILTCFGLAVFSLIGFVLRELTAPAPVVDLSLFRNPEFSSCTTIGFVMFVVMMSSMILLPLFTQELMGYSAFESGVLNLPRILVMVVFLPLIGRFYQKVDPRLMIAIGIVIYYIGALGQFHYSLQSSTWQIIIPNTIQGISFGFLFVPLTTMSLSTIPKHRMADATGLNSLIRQIGGAIGVSVFATLLTNDAFRAKAVLGSHITELNPMVMQRLNIIQNAALARGMDPVAAHQTAIASLQGTVMQQSMLISFDGLFRLSGTLFLVLIPLLFFMKVNRKALTADKHFNE